MSSCTMLKCRGEAERLTAQSKLFHALSDPTRLAILQCLMVKPLRVVDLIKYTGRAQPNVSAHIALLRDCGLVKGESHGRETTYSIAEPEIITILKASERVAASIGHSICSCPLLAVPGERP